MFVFGHLGFGSVLARPWRDRAGRWALLAGMLLPDVIDKPLYYARLSEFFSCTRTVGHTGLLVLVVLLTGVMSRRQVLVALAIGMATHLILDCVMDVIVGGSESSAMRAAVWPLMGTPFARVYMSSVSVHIEHLVNLPIFVTEAVGAVLLVWELRRRAKLLHAQQSQAAGGDQQ
ncbi:MAG: metal-dependent hydrolase [Acidobacteriota bacterium]